MATASEIVVEGFREGNLIALDQPLTTAQAAEGLRALNGFIDALYGITLGEFAMDWPVAPRNNAPTQARFPLFPENLALRSDVYPFPPPNVRLLVNVTADTTVWFPQQPADGARIVVINLASAEHTVTLQGNGRLVEAAASVSGTPSALAGRQYLYRADFGDWRVVSELTDTDQSPFPLAYDDLLALGVLDRLAARYGRSMTSDQIVRKAELTKRMKTQYRQPTPAPVDALSQFALPLSDPDRSTYYGGVEFNGGTPA